MSTYLPPDIQNDLDTARIVGLRKTSRLRVIADGAQYPVLRRWATGFAVDAQAVPMLRGRVDLYEGTHHLAECLIVASEEEGGEMRYDFKRATPAQASAPLDFYRPADAPIALLDITETRST